jgi:arginyl-tRNA synthetase
METANPTGPTGALGEAVAAAAADLHPGVPDAALERPPRSELGDYSTNAAMLAAPLIGAPPRDVAARLADGLRERLGDSVEKSEVAGPGFVNLYMSEPWMRDAAALIAARGRGFGAGIAERPRSVLVEFVSANPTGPLTVASGRHLAYGDSLARILEFAGHRVAREYYLNDAGSQIDLFGASIAARIAGTEVPEGGYEGAYVADLGELIAAEHGTGHDDAELGELGVELVLAGIRETLERSRVSFDSWASERSLHEAGATDAAIADLRDRDLVYDSEGAVWLRTSRFGDDKDRVLIRADGAPTYFAADIAYHRDKLQRGFDLLIDVLGADHHGYVDRMRAAIVALEGSGEAFEVPIMQMVNLLESGERARMSKRRGEFARLDELLDDIGVDATRFFMLMRSHETPIDIDLDLARAHSSDNPVYYAQYAHARICSIFRTADQRGTESGDEPAPAGTLEPAERALIARLLEAPDQIRRAATKREPHGITTYVREIAADFHAFYRDCQVVGAGPGLEQARLTVCAATRDVIATQLDLLGVEAPEEM